MPERALQIVRAALQELAASTAGRCGRVRVRFAALGQIRLTLEPRQLAWPSSLDNLRMPLCAHLARHARCADEVAIQGARN